MEPLALIGGIFGYGLKRNVLECYKFVCRNYVDGDEIYLFGFSRGAFTIRVLIELIETQGILSYSNSEGELTRLAGAAFRAYRANLHTVFRLEQLFRLLRDVVLRTPYHKLPPDPKWPAIKFVGLWDTVAAYGLPLEEMTRIVSLFFFPLRLCSDRLPSFVKKVCHALSLDDERKTFHPLLIREAPEDVYEANESGYRTVAQERITQVWFAGVHANVGGGYPDDSMAYVPLRWMIDQVKREIRFKHGPDAEPDALRQIATSRDVHGRMYNSRSGMAAYYRYAPRSLPNICVPKCANGRTKIHVSVLERIGHQVHAYAPIGLPETYDLVDDSNRSFARSKSAGNDDSGM